LKVILLEHPTRGLDIRSTDWIWQQMDERRKEGTAILFISADLEEIIERSDRIAVFSAGRMSRIVDAAKTNVDELGHLIGGQQ
jgi:simple sugar transport system ATP-binding protein